MTALSLVQTLRSIQSRFGAAALIAELPIVRPLGVLESEAKRQAGTAPSGVEGLLHDSRVSPALAPALSVLTGGAR